MSKYSIIEEGVLTETEIKEFHRILYKLKEACRENIKEHNCGWDDGCPLNTCCCTYDELGDTLDYLERDYGELLKNDVE